ncbi:hypothetical protein [Christiangramia aquimixticola]|uniref:hypothetical protein n=1 Tax=Christiangramia aquimixticola TaxID=1697558 RepID=UPI003AA9D92F
MENFRRVKEKLTAFIQKYYINLILKGALLFLTSGLIYFIAIAFLEHFLWFGITGRTILFWVFISVEILLLIYFIGIPLLKLFRLSKGISDYEASVLIGKHFPEVSDKLTNLLQLNDSSARSDLLLASIDQRSKELHDIPFLKAIDLSHNRYYLRFVLFPVLIIAGLYFAGRTDTLTNSFNRITNYQTAYLKPAPFKFYILNDSLTGREDQPFVLRVNVKGDYLPENIQIHREGNSNYMKQVSPETWEFVYNELQDDFHFSLSANGITSEEYELKIIKVPKLIGFEVDLDFPDYIGKPDKTETGTGNFTIPEGTRVIWKFDTQNTNAIQFQTRDSSLVVPVHSNKAIIDRKVFSNLDYSIGSSNSNLSNYEPLDYSISVIKDTAPEIEIYQKTDSLNIGYQYFKGVVRDDYGINKVDLVYFKVDEPKKKTSVRIAVGSSNFAEFLYSFPGDLELEQGEAYNFFFRVFDNDAVNGSKTAQSQMFSYRKKTRDEVENELLQDQKNTIENFTNDLEKIEESREELEELNRIEKESDKLDYNKKRKLEEFLKRQKEQNSLMKNYSEKLKKNLEQLQKKESDNSEKELMRRLEENEKNLDENEALLKELEKYSEKIEKEDLGNKLEELSKRNKNSTRNLSQLLELTKKYYVEEKKQKLARDLEKLGEAQEKLSKEEEGSLNKQQELSKKFEEFQEELDQLEKENKELKDPQDLGREEEMEKSIGDNQKAAGEELKKEQRESAKKKQEDAAKKMKKMSNKMQQLSMQQKAQQLEADVEVLRQILDNLIVFSFEQEALLNVFSQINQKNPKYARSLKVQSDLRENFKHIDDSLYTLALSNPMINEKITEKLTDVEFDLEKSLERLSENEIPQGTSSQQYVVTGANDLAILLDLILGSMQEQLGKPGSGSGDGKNGFQLQDIIQGQQKLGEELKEGLKPEKGEQGKESDENGEGESERLFEIYKQQQMLRMQLEELLKEEGVSPNNNATKQMKKIEEELLDKGMDPQTLKRMQQLQYELIKFEKANQLQGKDQKRKSETNVNDYNSPLKEQINRAKEYFNSTEILNRQALPLRQIYRDKVKEYFGKGRD